MESDPRRDQRNPGSDDAQDHAAPGIPSCPKCGWHNVRLSHSRSPVDAALGMLSISAFRCRSCGTRFRRFFRRREE
jgi:hypothetical protein